MQLHEMSENNVNIVLLTVKTQQPTQTDNQANNLQSREEVSRQDWLSMYNSEFAISTGFKAHFLFHHFKIFDIKCVQTLIFKAMTLVIIIRGKSICVGKTMLGRHYS